MKHVIGFTGLIGSGKTQAARCLDRHHGFMRVRFAGPLKAMMLALGLTPGEVDGPGKEHPCSLLDGQTPRHAMQTLGTEWGRHLISVNLWVRAWERQVRKAFDNDLNVVADDVRFGNEAEAIRGLGGIVVRVLRPGIEPSGHASEQQVFGTDLTIVNDGTLADLQATVDKLVMGKIREAA